MKQTPSTGRICIVANELTHLFRNGGIGTHNWLLADSLADAGWNVHILYCADIENSEQLTNCRQILNAKGISLWHINEFARPAEDTIECGLTGWIDKHSMHVRRALEQLDATHHFELIEFAEWAGYAFRSVQAHKMSNAFPQAQLIVKLHSSSQWCRDGNRNWLSGSDDLIRDYFERYAFENADYQLSPSQYMLDYAASIGWNVRPEARVIPYCYPASSEKTSEPSSHIAELVFFGRLEQRKGLKLFVEVARSLPSSVAVSFMGKETPIDGIQAGQYIAQMMGDRPFTLHTEFDRDQAMNYLRGANRVAVMPSMIENYPFTVLECATNGIPFLASNVGGIPEIVSTQHLQQSLLFDPNPRAFKEKLDKYVTTDASTRQSYVRELHHLCNSTQNRASVCRSYSGLLPQESSSSAFAQTRSERQLRTSLRDQPLVTITVPYYNLGELLPETLASIEAQDYPNIEVIVVNDGSTDAYALEVWQLMQVKYPRYRFVTQTNRGLGAARNTGLALATGEYFLPIDSDNVGRTDMVSRFVEALQQNPEIAVATCFFLAFAEMEHIPACNHPYAYRPCGGPFVAAALRNVYGDANAMSRTDALRAVGGYETEKHTTCEDWEMYVKLVRQGYRVDVVPEYLFYYRHRPTSLLRTTDSFLNRRRVLRQFFPSALLPPAEQMQLWTALASFEEQQKQHRQSEYQSSVALAAARQMAESAVRVATSLGVTDEEARSGIIKKRRKGMRLAVYNFREVMRKTTRYHIVFNKIKRKQVA